MKSNKAGFQLLAPRKSLRNHIFAGIIIPMTMVLVLLFLMNSTLLSRFYQVKKQEDLRLAFQAVNAAGARNELLSQEFQLRFEQMCDRNNLSIVISKADGSVVLSFAADDERMVDRLRQTIFTMDENEVTLLETTDEYMILRQQDPWISGTYLVLSGNLSGGDFILIRTAVSGIQDSVNIANRFLFYGALAMIILGLLASFLIAGYITWPVRELTVLARRMAHLDFDAKYEPSGQIAEIDELGNDMNAMFDELKGTIENLKTANSDLKRDIERREKNEQMRREFLSNVSHELKTPIAVISGYAEGLMEGVASDEESMREYVSTIHDEAGHMGRLVQDIVSLNTLEYGDISVDMERLDLYEIVSGIVRSHAILAEQYGAVIENDVTPGTYIWADESLTEQIVSNYLSNAIHYSKNEKKIRLYGIRQKDRYRFCVYNTGDPIPEESIGRLWDNFYKVDKARSREYGGTGIGLSLVKASAENMQQQYGVVNNDDGVTFWVTFDA